MKKSISLLLVLVMVLGLLHAVRPMPPLLTLPQLMLPLLTLPMQSTAQDPLRAGP